MSAALDVSRPTPLRLVGFVFTTAGGLMIAAASLQTWATVGIVGDEAGVIDTAILGVDQAEGKATLAMGVAILVAVVALRIVGSNTSRRAVAMVIVLSAAGALLVGGLDLADTRDRFDDAGADRIIETISTENRIPIDEVRRQYEAIGSGVIEITAGPGLWLLLAGGVLGLIGGLLDLAWVGRMRLQNAVKGADTSG